MLQTDLNSLKNSNFTYNQGRYQNQESGCYISRTSVKALTLKRIAILTEDLQQLGDLLIEQKVSLTDWQIKTAHLLKLLHTQQFLLGVGGQNSIVFDDYLVLGRKLKEQYEYLQNFAITVTQGIYPFQFRHQLSLYASSARGTYYLGLKSAAKRDGKTHGLRKLGASEKCAECEFYPSLGLTPIDEIVLPTCQGGCQCDVIFTTLEEAGGKGAGGQGDSTSRPVHSAAKPHVWLDSTVYKIDFTAGEYIVDKNGRWRDKNGRFVDMPDISEPEIKDVILSQIEKGKSTQARRLIRDIEKLKLLNLSTSKAYKSTVDKLKRKYKKDPFVLSTITSLQLDRGVSNKKNAIAKIQELEKLISTQQSPQFPKLKQSLRQIELKQVEMVEDIGLNLTKNTLKDKDKAAFEVISQYRETVQELNSVLATIQTKDNLDDVDYEELMTKRDVIWRKMKNALDTVQSMKDDYLSEPILDDYLDKMLKVSRESPGGYKIVIPKEIEELKRKSQKLEC